MNFEEEVKSRLQGKYHLIPIFQSVYNIPERLREYDFHFFIVFNTKKQAYEVHSLENPFSTYCLTLPFPQLDKRTLDHVWKNDLKLHGEKIFIELEKEQERWERDKDREFKRWVEDVGKETRPLMAKSAWT